MTVVRAVTLGYLVVVAAVIYYILTHPVVQ